ncbi:hypothetical protein WICPIJ_002811 [Wickerhamomyces pijperi]|uniref:RING-type E3 ubiquitin transferase n=1 Tax=Wickerhamomyces pijperi TaxID=599730 RepID=A0A9P8TPU0_WICPI|nr:hypothetical protein WICPIJ_002811 [Wickerhamomyces pijperi]
MSEPLLSESSNQPKEDQVLPFADAPSIVRAHQKDSYFESVIRSKLLEVTQIFTGQRFVHTHPEELTVAAKALYLATTTLTGSRTLGEEYADLFYVTRSGKKLPKLAQRIGFILSYAILPYLVTRLIRKYFKRSNVDEDDGDEDDQEGKPKTWSSFLSRLTYTSVIDSLMSLHLAIFYLKGSYYNISKRLFGLRYSFGHTVNRNEAASNGGYELLGGLILAQLAFKLSNLIKDIHFTKLPEPHTSTDQEKDSEHRRAQFSAIPHAHASTAPRIDLSNEELLPYIPSASRNCMLCLDPMKDPCCATCGHIFCWSCISNWARENPECPLCRQDLTEQALLPLR